jgi:hypothetical protein
MDIRKPSRIRHSYTQQIIASPEQVFPLLCPVREADWVPGWTTGMVLSESGTAEQGCIFTTPDDDKEAIWIITRYDLDNTEVEMYKVAPGKTLGHIEIKVRADEDDFSTVEIAYTFTALGESGEAFLKTFTQSWFDSFMQTWQAAMNHYLATGECVAVKI